MQLFSPLPNWDVGRSGIECDHQQRRLLRRQDFWETQHRLDVEQA